MTSSILTTMMIIAAGACAFSQAAHARERDCRPHSEAPVPIIDRQYFFPGLLEPHAMQALYQDFQISGKRFEYRGYLADGRYLAPLMDSNNAGQTVTRTVELGPALLQAIATHIKTAFDSGFAKYTFLPDMGHGHPMLPKAVYERLQKETAGDERALYEKAMNHPELKIVYHTSELLKWEDDGGIVIPELAFLRDHRNIVASVANPTAIEAYAPPGPPAAVMSDMVTFTQFYMSVSPEGCLPIALTGQSAELGMDLAVPGPSFVPGPNDDE